MSLIDFEQEVVPLLPKPWYYGLEYPVQINHRPYLVFKVKGGCWRICGLSPTTTKVLLFRVKRNGDIVEEGESYLSPEEFIKEYNAELKSIHARSERDD